MSDKNNDYLNLSVEISNEIGDRMINQSKLKLENTKEMARAREVKSALIQ